MTTLARRLSRGFVEEAKNTATLHGFVLGVGALFSIASVLDPTFRDALTDVNATYQFRSGRASRVLVLENDRARTRFRPRTVPDFTLHFLDLDGALRTMSREPEGVLRLLSEGRIRQEGNDYYLFQFGYLVGLCERRLRDVTAKLTSLRGAASHHAETRA